jgi:hypothetical protein
MEPGYEDEVQTSAKDEVVFPETAKEKGKERVHWGSLP